MPVRASKLLKDWAGEGYVTQEQYQRLKQETVSDLRTTNIFLRIVLFLFTLIGVGAAAALFFVVFLQHSSDQTSGVFLMIGAVVCYAAAEFAASQGRLYRYGIEEALAACSVGFLYFGMQAAFFSGRWYSPGQSGLHSLVPATCIVLSLWIWRRFGLWYAFPAAMVFAVLLAGNWASSNPAQHGIVAALYAIGTHRCNRDTLPPSPPTRSMKIFRSRKRFSGSASIWPSISSSLRWICPRNGGEAVRIPHLNSRGRSTGRRGC